MCGFTVYRLHTFNDLVAYVVVHMEMIVGYLRAPRLPHARFEPRSDDLRCAFGPVQIALVDLHILLWALYSVTLPLRYVTFPVRSRLYSCWLPGALLIRYADV